MRRRHLTLVTAATPPQQRRASATVGRTRLGPDSPESHGRLLASQLGATFSFLRLAAGTPARERNLRRRLADAEYRILGSVPRIRDAALVALLEEWEPDVVEWGRARLEELGLCPHFELPLVQESASRTLETSPADRDCRIRLSEP